MNALPLEARRPLRWRGRLQLLAILGVVLGPILLASGMYRYSFWVPEGRAWHGELIGDGRDLASLGVASTASGHWQLLVSAPQGCAENCRQLLYLARQINIGLGREADRAGHALALSGSLPAELQVQLREAYPQLQRTTLDVDAYRRNGWPNEPQLWLVDPHGNLVLRYADPAQGKGVLEDLRRLLKLSRIG